MKTAKRIYVVGTCDTKGAELNYAADLIAMAGASCVVVDVSTSAGTFAADVRKWSLLDAARSNLSTDEV